MPPRVSTALRFILAILPILVLLFGIKGPVTQWRSNELQALSRISYGAQYQQFRQYFAECRYSRRFFCMPGREPDATPYEDPGLVADVMHLPSAYWWVGTAAFRDSAQTGVLFFIASLLGIVLVAWLLGKATWWIAVLIPIALPAVGIAVLWILVQLLWLVVFAIVGVLVYCIPWVSGTGRSLLENLETISAVVRGGRETSEIVKHLKVR
jgi:hypothetical protein